MALTVLIDWLFSNHFQNYPARLYENKTNQYILLITMKITDLILIMKKLIIQIMFGENLNLNQDNYFFLKRKNQKQKKLSVLLT